jgi:hypothetical protein
MRYFGPAVALGRFWKKEISDLEDEGSSNAVRNLFPFW